MTNSSVAEKLPFGETVHVPQGWTLWRNGSDTSSRYWIGPDGRSTLSQLDEPTFTVRSPVVRTYPGIYFMPDGERNGYIKDLEIDVIMPTSLDYLEQAAPVTEADSTLRERAVRLHETNRRQLENGWGNLYIPDGEVLVKVAEPERQDDSDLRRIVYVPEPFCPEYQRLQALATPEQ